MQFPRAQFIAQSATDEVLPDDFSEALVPPVFFPQLPVDRGFTTAAATQTGVSGVLVAAGEPVAVGGVVAVGGAVVGEGAEGTEGVETFTQALSLKRRPKSGNLIKEEEDKRDLYKEQVPLT